MFDVVGRLMFVVTEERVVGVDVRLAEPGKLVTVEPDVRGVEVAVLRVVVFPKERLTTEAADVRLLL